MANVSFDPKQVIGNITHFIEKGDDLAKKGDYDNAIRQYHQASLCCPTDILVDDGCRGKDESVQDLKQLHCILYSKLAGKFSEGFPSYRISLYAIWLTTK